MFFSDWRSFSHRPTRARRSRGLRVRCEELEPRFQPSATPFFFSTGAPDGQIATLSRTASTGKLETETADDFTTSLPTNITDASFIGLLVGGATPADVKDVEIELYHVFHVDSTFPPDNRVITRVNSPSDSNFAAADGALGQLSFTTTALNPNFHAANSVVNGINPAPNQSTGGEGPVTGQEVQINVHFTKAFTLSANDHIFFRPEVDLGSAGNFLWLSAPKPILPAPLGAGTPFANPANDLQTWIRTDGTGALAPDWERIGTDVTNQGPFNASFSLSGTSFTTSLDSLSQNAAPEGSSNLALTVSGSEFTNQSTVRFNGMSLATTFVNTGQLQATIPAALLATEGTANITVFDPQNGLSNAQTFAITENVPALSASATHGRSLQSVTVSGQVFDQALEDHQVRINWGDGTVQTLDLGSSRGGPFSLFHHYKGGGPRVRTINVTARNDVGTVSNTLRIPVRVHK
jgi:IPT/TIG domain